MNQPVSLIVGASLAGASAALALRSLGAEGRVILLGEERHLPYERPELSKGYLRGEPDAHLEVTDAEAYRRADIELLPGVTALALDATAQVLTTSDGPIRFERLLLATGATARRLAVPGADLQGVHTLRTREDADHIREAAKEAGSVVVVGGGWIGAEVAASLRQTGRQVTLVTQDAVPLQRVLGPEIGAVYAAAHRRQGVTLVPDARVSGFTGGARVESVQLGDGRSIPADLVVVGVGAEPRTELARDAGLRVEDGVVVDERLQTEAPGIFAAGDVAGAWHPFYGRHVRVEHWDNAKRQGKAAAAAMLGRLDAYDRIPSFFSDQYDLSMEYTGYAPRWDDVVLRGDPDEGAFVAFWRAEGRVIAGLALNTKDVMKPIERLIRSRRPVDAGALADPDTPLEA